MVATMEAVSEGKMNISAAAKFYSVPRKTLDDRVKGKVTHGIKPGLTTALSKSEEDSLANYLVYMAERDSRLLGLWRRPSHGQLPSVHGKVIGFTWNMD